MNLARLTVLVAVLAFSSTGMASGHGKHGKGGGKMHANPMPNLMKVVKMHGDQLKLTPEQDKALADWRGKTHTVMHEKMGQVVKMEKAINAAAMAGKSKAEIMGMTARMLNVRRDIVSTKIDCRNNMRRILSPEQFEQVLKMYKEMHS